MISYLKQTLISFFLFLAVYSFAQVPANQTGMKLFDDYLPDKTANVDVSDLLQTAVDFCIANNRTLYISPGTYLVTKQILATVQIGENCGSLSGAKSIVITGDAFNRPVIKLQDGAVGFQNSAIASATPVIHVKHALETNLAEACLFWCQIKNLDFDLGNNPGAVAVKLAGAQDTQLSNIKVYGQNFAAGFTGVPGRNSGTFNCEVVGGQYAFYLNNSLGATLYGIKCVNQSVAALYIAIWRGPAIVGLEISGCSGTGIICRNTASGSVDTRFYQGHLVLTDARVELTNSANYAFDIADRGLVLKNVYVNGTSNIVKSNSGNWTESNTGWGRIKSGTILPTNINSFETFNVIDNVKSTTPVKEFETAIDAPANFVTKHIPNKIYAFNSPGAVSVATYGALPTASATVNYNAIQKAINENDIVFIPTGRYSLSSPLTLKNNSVLFGDPGKRTVLTPTYTPTSNAWLISTPDIDGYCVIQDFAFNTRNIAYDGAIRWQTSKGFLLNVKNYLAGGWDERARINYYFRGRAGGKFFNIADHVGLYDSQLNPSPDFHKVVVEGTTNPITFYGLNIERGGNAGEVPQNPYADFINAKNIRAFGTKTETDGLVYRLTNCDNVSLNYIVAHAHIANLVDSKVVGIYNSTNIEVNIVICPYTKTAGLTMIDDDFDDYVKRDDFLGTYRIGNFDPSVFDLDNTTALKKKTSSKHTVFPTMTKGQLSINNWSEIEKIKIVDLSGHLLKEWNARNQIDIAGFGNGIYFVQLIDNSGIVYLQKVIKI